MRSVLTTFATLLPLVAAAALAQPASSAHYRLEYQDINAAGGHSTSASFALNDCVGTGPEATGKSSSTSYVLYAACAAAIPAFLPSDDDDGDGVANGVESAAPNGGDGNDDGIPDEMQGNVASIPSAGRDGYETLEACVDPGCATPCQARQVRAISPADLPQQGEFNFPAGLLGFVLDCSQANVHILYHAFDHFPSSAVYEKYGPNPPGSATSIYYALPGVVFGSEAVGSDPAVASARFVLTDGAVGDATPVDGTIIDPGGPAFDTASAAPALSPKAIAVALLLLTLTAFFAMRRRRSDGSSRS